MVPAGVSKELGAGHRGAHVKMDDRIASMTMAWLRRQVLEAGQNTSMPAGIQP